MSNALQDWLTKEAQKEARGIVEKASSRLYRAIKDSTPVAFRDEPTKWREYIMAEVEHRLGLIERYRHYGTRSKELPLPLVSHCEQAVIRRLERAINEDKAK